MIYKSEQWFWPWLSKQTSKDSYNLDKWQFNCYRRPTSSKRNTKALNFEELKSKQQQTEYGRGQSKKIVVKELYKKALVGTEGY